MKIDDITAAIAEAHRFIYRAEELMAAQASEEQRVNAERDHDSYAWTSPLPKESGAVRRASMDLTRALAKMRGAK